jgi:hypothetical protein
MMYDLDPETLKKYWKAMDQVRKKTETVGEVPTLPTQKSQREPYEHPVWNKEEDDR